MRDDDGSGVDDSGRVDDVGGVNNVQRGRRRRHAVEETE